MLSMSCDVSLNQHWTVEGWEGFFLFKPKLTGMHPLCTSLGMLVGSIKGWEGFELMRPSRAGQAGLVTLLTSLIQCSAFTSSLPPLYFQSGLAVSSAALDKPRSK